MFHPNLGIDVDYQAKRMINDSLVRSPRSTGFGYDLAFDLLLDQFENP